MEKLLKRNINWLAVTQEGEALLQMDIYLMCILEH